METDLAKQLPDEHPLDWAARIVSGRSVLAKKLGVSVAAIGNWKIRGVPIEKCFKVELATDGLVSRRLLRPKDWREIWPEIDQYTVLPLRGMVEYVAQEA